MVASVPVPWREVYEAPWTTALGLYVYQELTMFRNSKIGVEGMSLRTQLRIFGSDVTIFWNASLRLQEGSGTQSWVLCETYRMVYV